MGDFFTAETIASSLLNPSLTRVIEGKISPEDDRRLKEIEQQLAPGVLRSAGEKLLLEKKEAIVSPRAYTSQIVSGAERGTSDLLQALGTVVQKMEQSQGSISSLPPRQETTLSHDMEATPEYDDAFAKEAFFRSRVIELQTILGTLEENKKFAVDEKGNLQPKSRTEKVKGRTGTSEESKEAALKLFENFNKLFANADTYKERALALDQLSQMLKSEWLAGVVTHHKEVATKLQETVEKVLTDQFNGNIKGVMELIDAVSPNPAVREAISTALKSKYIGYFNVDPEKIMNMITQIQTDLGNAAKLKGEKKDRAFSDILKKLVDLSKVIDQIRNGDIRDFFRGKAIDLSGTYRIALAPTTSQPPSVQPPSSSPSAPVPLSTSPAPQATSTSSKPPVKTEEEEAGWEARTDELASLLSTERAPLSPTNVPHTGQGAAPWRLEDSQEQAPWLKEGAEQPLNIMYEHGVESAKKGRYGEAEIYFNQAIDQAGGKHKSAEACLFWIKKKSYGMDTMYKKGVELAKSAEKSRDDEEKKKLFGQAKKFFELADTQGKKADKTGHGPAEQCLGYMYENGLGVEIDTDKAREWFNKASGLGYGEEPSAPVPLSTSPAPQQQKTGLPVDKVPGEQFGIDSLRSSVEFSKPPAESNTPVISPKSTPDSGKAAYDKGVTSAKTAKGLSARGQTWLYREAKEFFQRAADAGHARAKLCLGYMYACGLGGDRDFGNAVRLYCEAQEGGVSQNDLTPYMEKSGAGYALKDPPGKAPWLEEDLRSRSPSVLSQLLPKASNPLPEAPPPPRQPAPPSTSLTSEQLLHPEKLPGSKELDNLLVEYGPDGKRLSESGPSTQTPDSPKPTDTSQP